MTANDTAAVVAPNVERALRYVAALEAGGEHLTAQALNKYATTPAPRDAVWTSPMDVGMTALTALNRVARLGDPVTDYLADVGWVDVVGELLYLTPRGKALLRGLSDPTQADTRASSPLVVVLEPKGVWTDYHLTRTLSEAGEGLVADPYLGPEQVAVIAQETRIRRLLTSTQKNCVQGLPETLSGLAESGTEIPEVRMCPDKSFHDRAMLHDDGHVTVLGSSLNSVGAKLSLLIELPSSAAKGYREHIEKLWGASTPVTPQRFITPPRKKPKASQNREKPSTDA